MNENEIEINKIVYVRKDTIKNNVSAKKNSKGMEYCIVRTYSAGVFAGYIDRKVKGQETTIFNSRRLWYWDGANSLSDVATNGVTKPHNCKFAVEIAETDLKQVIEVIPCTEKAEKNIKEVKIWSMT